LTHDHQVPSSIGVASVWYYAFSSMHASIVVSRLDIMSLKLKSEVNDNELSTVIIVIN